eukprot:COSAG02_NODE_929_length_15840_cov_55.918493_8_plen_90_part_00
MNHVRPCMRIRSLDQEFRYSTGIPCDFELILILILILILNCSTVVLNYHKSLEHLLLRSVTQEGILREKNATASYRTVPYRTVPYRESS